MRKGELVYSKNGKGVYSISEVAEDGSATANIFVAEQGMAASVTISASMEGYGTMSDALLAMSPESFAINAVMSRDFGNLEQALRALASEIFKPEVASAEQQTADSTN